MSNFAVKLENQQFGTVFFDIVSSDNANDAATAATTDTGLSYLDTENPGIPSEANQLISDLQPNQYGAIDTRTLDPFGRS